MQVAEPAGTTLKHRWKTQMLPFASTCTRITSPQWPPFMLFGSVGQPSTRRYGLGSSVGLGYRVSWARAAPPNAEIAASVARNQNLVRPASIIANLSVNSSGMKSTRHFGMDARETAQRFLLAFQ